MGVAGELQPHARFGGLARLAGLVVEQDEEPPEGAIVVALLRGGEEVTVKRVYREGRMVRLKPQNGEHRDILVPAAEVELQGRVVYVLHPPGDTLGNLPGR